MNRQETAALFGWVRNTYDPRMVMGDLEVVEWQRQLAAITPQDAAHAIRAHYAESTDRVMLADILRRGRLAKRDRALAAKSEDVVREIEAARDAHERCNAHAAYLEARAAFERALAAKHPEPESEAS